MMIATKYDLETLLSDPAARDAALSWLQAITDERYQFGADGAWGIVEPNGLTRLGLTAAEAVALGAADRAMVEPGSPGVDLNALRAAKTAENTANCEAVLAPLGAEYGDTERATWDQQYAEATALMASPTAYVPLLDAMASARGMDKAALAQRIIRNREAWVLISGSVVGQRQRIEDAIQAAETPEAVAAVDMTITLPG